LPVRVCFFNENSRPSLTALFTFVSLLSGVFETMSS
jgi:hypothetical protein